MTTVAQEREGSTLAGVAIRRREQWNARFDYSSSRPVDEPADYQICHITVTNPRNYSSNDAHARAIEAIGVSRFPATGISYNRLIMMDGQVVEAQPVGRRGAHTLNDKKLARCVTPGCPSRGGALSAPSYNLNVNARAYAIAQNVNDVVSDGQLDALARIMAADRVAGFVKRDAGIHGHRCCATKECPGNKLWARMGELAVLVHRYTNVQEETPSKGDWTDMATKEDFEEALNSTRHKQFISSAVHQALAASQVATLLKSYSSKGVWGAWFGKGDRRKTAATVLAEILQVLSEVQLTHEQAERVASAAAALGSGINDEQ